MLPKPNEGADEVAGAGAPPPKRPPDFGASPLGFPNPPKPPKLDVDGAPAVACPPPKRPPGLLAGVLDAPPPKTLDELVAVLPLPNRPPLVGAEDVLLAVPNKEGVAAPDELGAAPNSGLLGVLPLLFCWPNENDILAVVEVLHSAMYGWWLCSWVGGCLRWMESFDAQLAAPQIARTNGRR